MLGVILGLILGLPHELAAGAGGQFDLDYKNWLGMTSPDKEAGYWLAFACAIGGGIIGAAAGALLVKLGMAREEDLKIE